LDEYQLFLNLHLQLAGVDLLVPAQLLQDLERVDEELLESLVLVEQLVDLAEVLQLIEGDLLEEGRDEQLQGLLSDDSSDVLGELLALDRLEELENIALFLLLKRVEVPGQDLQLVLHLHVLVAILLDQQLVLLWDDHLLQAQVVQQQALLLLLQLVNLFGHQVSFRFERALVNLFREAHLLLGVLLELSGHVLPHLD